MSKTLNKTIIAIASAMLLLLNVQSSVIGQQPFEPLPGEQPAAQPQAPAATTPASTFDDTSPDGLPDEPLPEQRQLVEVAEKFAGWQSAGTGEQNLRLSATLRANWVMMDANGRVEGTVRTVGDADLDSFGVYLLNRGRLVTSAMPDEQGNFEFNNVVPGPYSLIGTGNNGFFAMGLNIIAHSTIAHPTTPERIDVAAFQNKTNINLDWIRHFAPTTRFRVYGRYSAGESDQDPVALYGIQGLSDHSPAAAPATSISNHVVAKTSDGRLLGRVHQLNSLNGRPVDVRDTKIMLLQGDEVVASTTSDNYGVFEFDSIANGQYALVAAGVDGMGCIGITVDDINPDVPQLATDVPTEDDPANEAAVTMDPISAQVFDFTMVSSETIGWLSNFAHENAYRRAILAPRPPAPPKPVYPEYNPQRNRCRNNCTIDFKQFNRDLNRWFDGLFNGNSGYGGYNGQYNNGQYNNGQYNNGQYYNGQNYNGQYYNGGYGNPYYGNSNYNGSLQNNNSVFIFPNGN